MDTATAAAVQGQLEDRRERLHAAITEVGPVDDLVRLLREVDSALSRIDVHSYGACEVCGGGIEDKDLLANPLIRYCLCNLSLQQQRALENDLDLAGRIQTALLPRQDLVNGGWQVHYRYQPVGPVSGDYCDLVPRPADDGEFLFAVGDVSGKGVAASLLMAHLNASFRSLSGLGLPLQELVARANRLLLERTIATHYATLACGCACGSGKVEIVNAGHCPPLLVRKGKAEAVAPTGFPIGMVGDRSYAVRSEHLGPGDMLFLYTDGLTEARDRNDGEYGAPRLASLLERIHGLPPRSLADAVLSDVAAHVAGAPRADDLTLMVLKRAS